MLSLPNLLPFLGSPSARPSHRHIMKKLSKCQNVYSTGLTRMDIDDWFFLKSSSKMFYEIQWPKQWKKWLFEPIWKEFDTVFFFKDIVCFKECPSGYFDENCSKVCEYPTFGKRCLKNCFCEKHLCDFLRGCKNGKYSLFIYSFEFSLQF